jgi:predicted type IV restriction endonuclease
VQCKRNAEDNLVGSPVIQQFKGVIEENNAWRGYIVTTSYFTKNAIDSASKSNKLKLIDITELLNWHLEKSSNSKEDTELKEAYELGFLSAEDYKRKVNKKTLSKKQLQQLEELEKAHKEGFLSDNDFEKRRKAVLSET